MATRRVSNLGARRITPALLLGSLLVLLTGTASADTSIHTRWQDFKPSGTYVFTQGDKQVDEARIYHSRRAAAFLVTEIEFDGVLLLEPRKSAVSKVAKDAVVKAKDGTYALKADAKVESLGKFTRMRRNLVIRVKGLEAELKPNPPLLAWKLCDDLRKHSPEYCLDAKAFELDEKAVKALQGFKGVGRVNVYFGSWCPTCTRYLGRLMRLEQALEKTKIKFQYYGLPKPPAMYRDPEVRAHRIRKLPSAVIYKDGKKKELIASSRWSKPAAQLARVLLGYSPGK